MGEPPPMVLLVRHGESFGQGSADPPVDDYLSAVGLAQAQALQAALAASGIAVDHVVASPLRRALQTALLTFPTHRVHLDARLREFNHLQRAAEPLFARHVGTPFAQLRCDAHVALAAQPCAEARVVWPDHPHSAAADAAASAECWWEPHGDVADAHARVRQFARLALVPLVHGRRLRVAVVAHENVIRSMADTLEAPNAEALWATLTPDGLLLLARCVPPGGWPAGEPARAAVAAADADDVAAAAAAALRLACDDARLLVVLALPDPALLRAAHRAVNAALDSLAPGPRRERSGGPPSARAALVARVVLVLDAGAGAGASVTALAARLRPAEGGGWPGAPARWALTVVGSAARAAALAAAVVAAAPAAAAAAAWTLARVLPLPPPRGAPLVSAADRTAGLEAAVQLAAAAAPGAAAAALITALPSAFATLGRRARAAALATLATGPPVAPADVGLLLTHLRADDAAAAMALLARVPALAVVPLGAAGLTALHHAARHDALACARFLLACHGASVDAVTAAGHTAWHFARGAAFRALLAQWDDPAALLLGGPDPVVLELEA